MPFTDIFVDSMSWSWYLKTSLDFFLETDKKAVFNRKNVSECGKIDNIISHNLERTFVKKLVNNNCVWCVFQNLFPTSLKLVNSRK